MKMPKAIVKVGPADHGKPMSLEDFDKAEAQAGHLYELSRGVIVVSDVPKRRHLSQVKELRRQITVYDLANPHIIDTIAGGGECKILIADFESERHPDLSIYKTSFLDHNEETLWLTWIPEIVIEVVSLSSEQRDYFEKREEYLRYGVKEYWIVDAASEELLVLRRSGNRWRPQTVVAPAKYTTRLLPGFELDIAAVFEAANQVPE
jgi:Uma2 family endonuclease